MDEPPDNSEPPDHPAEETTDGEPAETDADNTVPNTHRVPIEDGIESVSMDVVSTVAVYSDTAPTHMTPLATVIDPDALNMVFQSCGPELQVTFSYCDYDVTVHGTHEITLTS